MLLGGAWRGGCSPSRPAFFVFRLQGAYFAIGTWVIAEVVRLLAGAMEGARRRHRHLAAFGRDARRWSASTGLPAAIGVRASQARATSSAYWLALLLAAGTVAFIYGLLRSRQGLALAAIRDNVQAAASRRRRCRAG